MTLVKLFGALSHISQWTVCKESKTPAVGGSWLLSLCPFMAFISVSLNYSFVQNSTVQVSADKPILWWYCQSIAQNTVHTLPVQVFECFYDLCFHAFRY